MDIQNNFVSIIIFITTIAFSLYALYGNNRIFYKFALNPKIMLNSGKYYQIITSAFLHADLMHLGFNMMSFYFFAFQLENAIGPLKFFILYFFSMVISVIPSILKHKDDPQYVTIGASGAVSGIVFATILLVPGIKLGIFPFPIPIPGWLFGILFLLWSYYASKRGMDMINHSAHIWGAISGLIITTIFYPFAWGLFFSQIL